MADKRVQKKKRDHKPPKPFVASIAERLYTRGSCFPALNRPVSTGRRRRD